MEYRQVLILIRLPSSVWWLNRVVPLLILLLRNLLPVRKNKTSSSLIFTFRSFSTPVVMSIWINSFTTSLSTSPKILIQLYMIPCSFFSLFFAFVIFYFLENFLEHLRGKLVCGYYKLLYCFILEEFQILKDVYFFKTL